MWIGFAFASAFFAGITSILAKCGIKNTDSTVVTALRTVVVLIFSWIMVFLTQTHGEIGNISVRSWLFLILSGLATGGSWLCYFKSLQLGPISKVVVIDKSSVVLTFAFAAILLGESISLVKLLAIILITIGTFMMVRLSAVEEYEKNKAWIIYAILAATFASLTAILGKVGIEGVNSNLGTAIRTVVVIIVSFGMVVVTGKQQQLTKVKKEELKFIILSGIATGASWLCYYKALQLGQASVVVPIDKLSILVTVGFSYIVFKEKLIRKEIIGLSLIVMGTLIMLI